jgi:UDP-N-acetylglucosamine/UDP-N-acetylgalactosamine diphosphorylase
VVWKVEPGEKIGVIGKRKGKYTVIEYSEMNPEDSALRDKNGKLVYGAGNVCNHFYTVDFLSKVTDDALTFHVARKQVLESWIVSICLCAITYDVALFASSAADQNPLR